MDVLEQLRKTKFPINRSRKNIGALQTCFAMGDVMYYRNPCRGPSQYNKKFPVLLDLLNKFMKSFDPEFQYTTIQVNKNVNSLPHVDKNNVGNSYIIALGDFTGGDIVVEGVPYQIKDTFLRFDGTTGHWTTPFEGERYSLVFFTHTFKQPHPRLKGIEVKHDGLYKNNVLIKKYGH
jgi:hypothetical protein